MPTLRRKNRSTVTDAGPCALLAEAARFRGGAALHDGDFRARVEAQNPLAKARRLAAMAIGQGAFGAVARGRQSPSRSKGDIMNKTWRTFLGALAAPNQPAPVFLALQTIIREEVGAKLFTLMTFDARTSLSRRVHSSHPREYPVSGSKPLPMGVWSRTVIDERRTFVANTIEGIAEVFPDHELIHSLGCGSVVNLPVVFSGAVIGAANALDTAGHYTPERVARIERLSPFVTIALLAARRAEKGPNPPLEDPR